MAHSPRPWARALKQHVIDHGGGRIMGSIVAAEDALIDGYDVFVADDTTSFLGARFVGDLQRRAIAVVGVYDPKEAEGSGKQRLTDLQVDEVIEADAAPTEFLRTLVRACAGSIGQREDAFSSPVADVAGSAFGLSDPYEDIVGGSRRGRLLTVAGASGGVGATEVAIGLASQLARRGDQTVLVDADDIGPSVVQRLSLGVHPNLRSALDVVQNRKGDLTSALIDMPTEGFEVLGGLANRRDWFELRPSDLSETVLQLARLRDYIVINVSSRLEDLPAIGGPARYGATRSMLALADVIVLVAGPNPIGAARVLDWIAEAQPLIEATPLFVAFNAFNGGAFKAAEIESELRHVYQPRAIVFIPEDKNLAHATWQGELPGRGPFIKAMRDLSESAAPRKPASRRHRRKQ